MENSTKQALRELYDIICHMDQEIRKKFQMNLYLM